MATTKTPYSQQLRSLAELMLAVAGESVTVMKKNAPEQALKLKRQDEWGLYLEFIKVMFNLTDRLSAFHIPIKDQPEFMNGLEDAVTAQLKTALEPAFGSSVDQAEIMLTIGGAVAESRQLYERYRFSITEDSKTRNEMFDAFGGRVADALGVAGNPQITSAATLCATAVVPAITAILKGDAPATASGTSPPIGRTYSRRRGDCHSERSDGERDQTHQRDVKRHRRRSRNPLGAASAISPGPHRRRGSAAHEADEPSCESAWRTIRRRGILR